MNTILTIGRQYGSAGHEIGQELARQLNIPCYDKELLERAAKDSGLCKEVFENNLYSAVKILKKTIKNY